MTAPYHGQDVEIQAVMHSSARSDLASTLQSIDRYNQTLVYMYLFTASVGNECIYPPEECRHELASSPGFYASVKAWERG